MANWIGRATSLFHRPPPPAEPFQVECDCGGKVTGIRTSSIQRPLCASCTRPVFVLPLNVYPVPKTKNKKSASPPSETAKPARTGGNTIVVDDAAKPKSDSKSKTASTRPASASELALSPESSSPMITPLRMVTAGILLATALTIGGLWHRNRVETAKAVVAQAADAGRLAMQQKDFVKAAEELKRAQTAVDVIGRTDAAANEIRRLSREATAIAGMSSSTLMEVLQETLATRKKGQTEPLTILSAYRGNWMIFDSLLIPLTSADAKDWYELDAPLSIDDVKVVIEVSSPFINRMVKLSANELETRVIFAAQLKELSAREGDPEVARLTLDEKSLFLWTNYDNYAAIGYQPFDEEGEQQTRSLLDRQLEIQQK